MPRSPLEPHIQRIKNPHAHPKASKRIFLDGPHTANPAYQMRIRNLLDGSRESLLLLILSLIHTDQGSHELMTAIPHFILTANFSTVPVLAQAREEVAEIICFRSRLNRQLVDPNRLHFPQKGTARGPHDFRKFQMHRKSVLPANHPVWEQLDLDHLRDEKMWRDRFLALFQEGDVAMGIHTLCNWRVADQYYHYLQRERLAEVIYRWNDVPKAFQKALRHDGMDRHIAQETAVLRPELNAAVFIDEAEMDYHPGRVSMADPLLASVLKHYLYSIGTHVAHSEPYVGNSKHRTTREAEIAQERGVRFLCADFAKWLLSTVSPFDPDFDHAAVQLSQRHIDQHAAAVGISALAGIIDEPKVSSMVDLSELEDKNPRMRTRDSGLIVPGQKKIFMPSKDHVVIDNSEKILSGLLAVGARWATMAAH